MSKIEITTAGASERAVLERLLQLYEYDFSEILGNEVGPDGSYGHIDVGPFLGGGARHAYVVRSDGELAGFALVSREPARAGREAQVWWMAEFFVMRKHRRSGVGERLATAVFNLHPGTWEVGQVEANEPAQAFWRKVIGRYTSSEFQEVRMSDHRWRGPVQRFVA